MQSKKRALGRGLGALLPPRPAAEAPSGGLAVQARKAEEVYDGERVQRLPIARVRPNPNQPRQHFDETALQELAASIRAHGLIQPIVVVPQNGVYMIVAGERRWRAAQLAGFDLVPSIVLSSLSEKEVLEFALVENLQREDLNSIEEARAYKALIETFGISQEEVADRVGKSRPAIANALRLLKLPPFIQSDVESGLLSAGHARALLALPSPDEQRRLRDAIIRNSLSVRQAEQATLKKLSGSAKPEPARQRKQSDPNIKRLQDELVDKLTCRVSIKTVDENRGTIEIHYDNLDELERILDVMGIEM